MGSYKQIRIYYQRGTIYPNLRLSNMQSPYASIQSSPFEPVLFDASKCKHFQDIQYGEFVCNFGDETPSF